MALPLLHVDAFTDVPLRGNPAAVVVLDAERPEDWMQAVAAEMNLSETAFLLATGDAWHLRWFTPTVEVDLCGHATLASAHALWELGRAAPDAPLAFETRSGRLTAARRGARVELDFPALVVEPRDAPADVLAALGLDPDDVVFAGRHANGYGFITVETPAQVRALAPDFRALGRDGDAWLITAPDGDTQFDFVSRFFAPAHGIDEDPVTGAAHCMLGPYWSVQLAKPVVTGLQASARTGVVECEPRDDRMLLRGHAVTVSTGQLLA